MDVIRLTKQDTTSKSSSPLEEKLWARNGIDWLYDLIAACRSWNQGYVKMVPNNNCNS